MASYKVGANGLLEEVKEESPATAPGFATPAPSAPAATPDDDPVLSTASAIDELQNKPKNQAQHTVVSLSQGEFNELLREEEAAKRRAIVEVHKNKNQFFGPDLERNPSKIPQEDVASFAEGPTSSGAIFRDNKGLTGEATFDPETGQMKIDVNRLQHVHGGRDMQKKLAPKILGNLVSEADIKGNTPEEKHANYLAGQKQLQDEYSAISPERSFIDNATFISASTLALNGMAALGKARDPSKPFIDAHLIPVSDYTTLTGDTRLTDAALTELWKKQEPIASLAGTEGLAYNPYSETFQNLSSTASAGVQAAVGEKRWKAEAPELKGLEIDPRKYKSAAEFKAAINDRLHEDMLARMSKNMQLSGEHIGSASMGGLTGLAASLVSAPLAAAAGLGGAATGVATGTGVLAPATIGLMRIATRLLESAGAVAVRSPRIATMAGRLAAGGARVAAIAPRTAIVASKAAEHSIPVGTQLLGDIAANKPENAVAGVALGLPIAGVSAAVGSLKALRPSNSALRTLQAASRKAGGPLLEDEARAAVQAAHPNMAAKDVEKGVAKYHQAVRDDLAARNYVRAAAEDGSGEPIARAEMVHHVLTDDSAAARLQDDLYIQQRGGAAKNINGQRNLEAIDNMLRTEAGQPDPAGQLTDAMEKGLRDARLAIQEEISKLGHDVINGDGRAFVEHIRGRRDLGILHSKLPTIENEIGKMPIPDARMRLRINRFQGYIDEASLREGIISPDSIEFLRAVNTYSKGKAGGMNASLGEHVILREKMQEDLASLATEVDRHQANILTSRATLEQHLSTNTNRYPDQARMAQLLDAVDRYDGVEGSYSSLKLNRMRADILDTQALGRNTPEKIALDKIIGAKNAMRSAQDKTYSTLMDLRTIDHSGVRVVSGARHLELDGKVVDAHSVKMGVSLINTMSDIVGSGQSLRPHLAMLQEAAQADPQLASMFDTWVSANFESAIATGNSLRPTAYQALEMLRPHVAGDTLKLLNMLEVSGRIMDEDAALVRSFSSDVSAAISAGDSAALVGMLGRGSDLAARLTSKTHITHANNYARQLAGSYVTIATDAGMEASEALRTFQYLIGDEITRIRLHPQMAAKYGVVNVADAVGNKIAVNRVINKTWFDAMDRDWVALNMYGDGRPIDRDFLTAYFIDASCDFGRTGFFTERMTGFLQHFSELKNYKSGVLGQYTPGVILEDANVRRAGIGYITDIQRLAQADGQGRNEILSATKLFVDALHGKTEPLVEALDGLFYGDMGTAIRGFNGKESSEVLKIFNGADGAAGFVGRFDPQTRQYVRENYGEMLHSVFVDSSRSLTIEQRVQDFLANSGIEIDQIIPKYGHLVDLAARTNPANGRIPAIEALIDHVTTVWRDLNHVGPEEFHNAFRAHELQEALRYSSWERMNALLGEQSTTAGITYAPIQFRGLAFTNCDQKKFVGAANGYMDNGGLLFGADKDAHKFFHSSIEDQMANSMGARRGTLAHPAMAVIDSISRSLHFGATSPAKQVLKNKGEMISRIGFTDAASWIEQALQGYTEVESKIHTGAVDTIKHFLYDPTYRGPLTRGASNAAYLVADPIMRITASGGILSLSTAKALWKNWIGMNVKIAQTALLKGGSAAQIAVSPAQMAWRLFQYNAGMVSGFTNGLLNAPHGNVAALTHSPTVDQVAAFYASNLRTPAGIGQIQNVVTNLHAGRGIRTGWSPTAVSQKIGSAVDSLTGKLTSRLQENMEYANNRIHARDGARMFEELVASARSSNMNMRQIREAIAPEFGSLSVYRHIELADSIHRAAKEGAPASEYAKAMLDFTMGYGEHMVGRYGKYGGSVFMNTLGKRMPGAAMFFTAKTQALVEVTRSMNPKTLAGLLYRGNNRNLPPETSLHMLSALMSLAAVSSYLYMADYGMPDVVREGAAKLTGSPSAEELEYQNPTWSKLTKGISPGASDTAIFGSTMNRAFLSKGDPWAQIVKDLTAFSMEGGNSGKSDMLNISEAATIVGLMKITKAVRAYASAKDAIQAKLDESSGGGYPGLVGIELEYERQAATRKLVEDIGYAVADSTLLKMAGGGFMANPLIAIPSFMSLGEAKWQNTYEDFLATDRARKGAKPGTFAEPVKSNMAVWGLEKYYGIETSYLDSWLAMLVEKGILKLEDVKRLAKQQEGVGLVGDAPKTPEELPDNVQISDFELQQKRLQDYQNKLNKKK